MHHRLVAEPVEALRLDVVQQALEVGRVRCPADAPGKRVSCEKRGSAPRRILDNDCEQE